MAGETQDNRGNSRQGAGVPVTMPALWLIEPVASPRDPWWQDRRIWAEVLVAAPSPAIARLVAEHWALRGEIAQVGNETPTPRGGFLDEKLYAVRPAPSDAARPAASGKTAAGKTEVIAARAL